MNIFHDDLHEFLRGSGAYPSDKSPNIYRGENFVTRIIEKNGARLINSVKTLREVIFGDN
jgi:hypothetical protein